MENFSVGKMHLLFVAAWLVTARVSVAQNCNYSRYLRPGESDTMFTPGYPGNYPGGSRCSWRVQTDPGAQVSISCNDFNIPSSADCSVDRVSVSLTGDATLNDAHIYCGSGTFSLTTVANNLLVVLKSTSGTGGRFLCNIAAATPTSTTTAAPCSCGVRKKTRIVGGQQTGVNEFPMMAGIVDSQESTVFCGATIISNKYVVTAAHCLYNRNITILGVLVGDHNVTSGSETPYARLFRIEKVTIHPGYNRTTQENDIALVAVVGQFQYSNGVSPVCLPFLYTTTDFQGATVIVLGWGTTEFGGPTSEVLLGTDLKVLSPSACSSALESKVSPEKQFCTYNAGKDGCQSDSGGPVLWQDPNTGRLQLVGIISYGIGCATQFPAVNTRVTAYLTWITSVTRESFCVR